MAKPRTVGKLPPRYTLLVNPYSDERVSRCPVCKKLTHPRKFALFIHVDGWGPLTLGKTGPYCTPCELVVVHKADLEAELATAFAKLKPEVIGNDYLVIGTVDKKVWRAAMAGTDTGVGDLLERTADFKKRYDLHVTPGGWGPA